MSKNETLKDQTKRIHSGRDPGAYHGIVNPPIARASTILYPSLAAYEDPNHTFRYGRMGNPMSRAFEEAMSELEGGFKAISTGSGLSAITTSLLAFLKAGDHLLMVDTIYPPVRDFLAHAAARFGVETDYYDPLIGAGIADLIRENTQVIYMESPGSATFEVQDVPAIVKAAKAKGVTTIIDNTWAAGILCKPLSLGVDICLQSATKYIGGHADINLGFAVAAEESLYQRLKQTALDLGVCAGPEDMYLALRGLRTLSVRMKQAAENAARVLKGIEGHEAIAEIYYPPREGHAGHEIWKRDFTGANGIFSLRLRPAPKEAVHRFADSLKLFPIGSSWGGYESLLQPQNLKSCRSAVPWEKEGFVCRLQIGFEDPDDLIADLEQALGKFNAAP